MRRFARLCARIRGCDLPRLSAVDFFTVETVWLQRLYVLLFIELGSRRVHVARARLQRVTDSRGAYVQRRERLGGLLHEYNVAA